ncbi:MAG: biopolymer transporter ExbD [Zetaproteobacteria bacterium]|nr:MAG: biopolymer transporter ExbD [Zetaproteobacteria bacterium]
MNLRPHRFRRDPQVDLTPLIDVVFLMLIFFMVSTSFDATTALKLDLPTSHARADADGKHHPLVVAVRADGTIFVDGKTVADRDLRARLLAASGGDPERKVLLRADSDARHKRVVLVLDTLQQLGLNRIGIATMPAEEGE